MAAAWGAHGIGKERSGGEHGIGHLLRSRFSPRVCGHEKEATERADLPASHCRAPHVEGPTRHGVFPKLNK
jgi:hypothetical protein